jgi:hypothetical protein
MTLPQGFKTFSDGLVLTADEINGYLQQGILVFDDASARTTAMTGNLREGQYSYLKSDKSTSVYTGNAWVRVGREDIEFASEAARNSALPSPFEGQYAYTTDNLKAWKYISGAWRERPINNAYASEAARDTAFSSPTNGQYAYTTDLTRLWLRSGGAWVQQNASPVAADFSNTATGTYSSGGRSFKFVQFNSNGTLVCTRAGIARVLVVGGGGAGRGGTWNANGGSVFDGFVFLTAASHSVVIGAGGTSSANAELVLGGNSVFFGIVGKGGGVGAVSGGVFSDITGTSLEYGRGGVVATANRGDGGIQAGDSPGSAGVVVVRVET